MFNFKPKKSREFKNEEWSEGFKAGYITALNERPILSEKVMAQVQEKAVEEAIRRLKGGL